MPATPDGSDRRRRALLFLVITFLVTWAVWWPLVVLTNRGAVTSTEPLGFALLVLGGTAPTVVAYLAAWRTPEAGSVREFNRRVLHLRVPVALLVVAVVGAAAFGVVSLAVVGLVTGAGWVGGGLGGLLLFVPAFLTSIVFGGLEEVGWRGVLQPAVTDRWNLVTANLVIAVLWAVWHLPQFWVVGSSLHDASFALFLFAGIGYSAMMTWLYARTHSVALCVLFHAGINASATVGLAFPAQQAQGFAVQGVLLVTVGTVLLVAAQRRRGRPGERPETGAGTGGANRH